jgi:hypothetical protein
MLGCFVDRNLKNLYRLEVLNLGNSLNHPNGLGGGDGEGARCPVFGRKVLTQTQIGTKSQENRELTCIV